MTTTPGTDVKGFVPVVRDVEKRKVTFVMKSKDFSAKAQVQSMVETGKRFIHEK
jgi:hypothetical protein